METEWRDIPGYDNYEMNIDWVIRTKPKIITPNLNRHWYLSIRLSKDWIKKNKTIHRLVMQTFKWESDLVVNHIDWNKTNNSLDNLEYCTRSENTQHARNTWLCKHWTNNNIYQFDKNGLLIQEHTSIAQAARYIWCHPSSISQHLSWQLKTCKGYILTRQS